MKKIFVSIICLMLSIVLSPALAAGSSSTESAEPTVEERYEEAASLITKKDYEGGLEILLEIVEKDEDNADIHSLIGFSSRKSGDLEKAYVHYATALEIDPLHVGANEYLGELHVQVGDLDKANEQLEILAGICEISSEAENPVKVRRVGYSYGKSDNKDWAPLGCGELETLTEVIAEAVQSKE